MRSARVTNGRRRWSSAIRSPSGCRASSPASRKRSMNQRQATALCLRADAAAVGAYPLRWICYTTNIVRLKHDAYAVAELPDCKGSALRATKRSCKDEPDNCSSGPSRQIRRLAEWLATSPPTAYILCRTQRDCVMVAVCPRIVCRLNCVLDVHVHIVKNLRRYRPTTYVRPAWSTPIY